MVQIKKAKYSLCTTVNQVGCLSQLDDPLKTNRAEIKSIPTSPGPITPLYKAHLTSLEQISVLRHTSKIESALNQMCRFLRGHGVAWLAMTARGVLV